MSKHIHNWGAKFITIEGVDCICGMECECGEELTWNDVEGIVWLWQHDIPETDTPLSRLIEDEITKRNE